MRIYVFDTWVETSNGIESSKTQAKLRGNRDRTEINLEKTGHRDSAERGSTESRWTRGEDREAIERERGATRRATAFAIRKLVATAVSL